DRPALAAFLAGVRTALGPVGGVVHCAGRSSAGPAAFVHKEPAGIREVLAPKGDGLDALLDLTEQDPLAFVLLFSSVSAAAPVLAAGMTDYAAANAYLDLVARHRPGVRAVNWPVWRDSGGATGRPDAAARIGLHALPDDAGLDVLDRVLDGPAASVLLPVQAVDSGFDAEAALRIPHAPQPAPPVTPSAPDITPTALPVTPSAPDVTPTARYAPHVTQPAPRLAQPAPVTAHPAPVTAHPTPVADLQAVTSASASAPAPAGADAAQGAAGEAGSGSEVPPAWLVTVVAEALGIPEPELEHDVTFGDLGVESVLLAELVTRIEARTGRPLEPAVLLDHPTLRRLGAHLSGAGVAPTTDPVAPPVPAESVAHPVPTDSVAPPVPVDSVVPAAPALPVPPPVSAGSVPPPVSAGSVPPPVSAGSVPPPVSAGPVSPPVSADTVPPPMPAVPAGPVAVGRRIAVIGMACRFPGAPDLDAYWRLLRTGGFAVTEVPPGRWDVDRLYRPEQQAGRSISKWGGFVDALEDFDPEFFGMGDREARDLDPAIRLTLEATAACLRDAGYRDEELRGSDVGVFMGARMSGYRRRIGLTAAAGGLGGDQNFIAARVAHQYDFRGPALVVDSACSSALVSVQTAVRSLQAGESRLAVAGGVEVLLDEEPYLEFSVARALSPRGRCASFDKDADGFVPGEGCGVLLLKPLDRALADGDRVHAVLEAVAVGNDGHTMGLTTPNPVAQAQVVRRALNGAGVSARDIGLLEAHGTGTMIGDPLELRALTEVFRESTD
ncbi:KR domain-containing protein, partial [Streptomyces sp. SID161]|nr:KR domain-containing protein [Streptomyces sp. SID161]